MLWFILSSLYVWSGFPRTTPVPGLPIFFLSVFLASFLFAFSPAGKALALGIPIPVLLGFQVFRLPLKLVLHSWVEQRSIPQTMTWSGQNPDVLFGVIAIVFALLATKFRIFAWAGNLLGIGFLMNVLRVSMMSSPLPFAWDVTPKLQ